MQKEYLHTPKIRKKSWMSGKKHTEEVRRRISEAMRGRHPTEETKQKIRKACIGKKNHNFGKKLSKETRRKISEAKKGKPNGRTGKYHTEEAKEKMRKALIGNKNNLGKKMSKEARQKKSEYMINHPNRKFSNTSIERKIAEELTKRNIPFKQNIGVEKIANVDFLLGNKVIIQCDGCYWHNCKKHFPKAKNKVNDKRQDKQFKKLGYKIYRFWEHEINKSPEKCVNKLSTTRVLQF